MDSCVHLYSKKTNSESCEGRKMGTDDKRTIKYLKEELQAERKKKEVYIYKINELLKEHKRMLDLYFK